MQNHNGFRRIICVTILCALLMVSMGRATRVSAVGTTIAGAAAATLCAVGIVYTSYMLLTEASVHVPDSVENIQSWLSDMGSKVIQYPSGREAYEELYPEFIGIGDEPLQSILDRAWTWTEEKLKTWANDFSSTGILSSIAGTYTISPDYSTIPLNGYDYPFTIEALPSYYRYNGGSIMTLEEFTNYGWSVSIGAGGRSIMQDEMIIPTNYNQSVRNFKRASDGKFIPQYFDGSYWQNIGTFSYYSGYYTWTANGDTVTCVPTEDYWVNGGSTISGSLVFEYPFFPNDTIYDEETGEYSVLITPTDIVTDKIQWPVAPLPPDQDNKPVIPYLKLPFDPNWYDPITNIPGGGNWGFNLSRLLDVLEELANDLIEIGALGELINEFKNLLSGQDGDEYYIYYDDSEHNETFYQYYTITNYNGDVYQYDIDVSDVEEHLPVDLNTVSLYTHNNYLDEVKDAARGFGSAIGEYVAFWHNCDPVVTYTILGSFVLILLGAFIGKWGHS